MGRQEFGKVMKGNEALELDGSQYHRELDRELKHAERKTCNEQYDIRDTGVKQDDCFTPSGRKVVDRIIKSSEKPKVSQDSNLHSDTTQPGENTITGHNYEKKMAPGAEKLYDRLIGSAAPTSQKLVKSKTFNS